MRKVQYSLVSRYGELFFWIKMAYTVHIDKNYFKSEAYLSLKARGSHLVFNIFLGKRQVKKIKGNKRDSWVVSNNGEITFTYKEAKEIYRIPPQRFEKIIAELEKVGLIDIHHRGFGVHGDPTLFSISTRWADFGTCSFIEKKATKNKRGCSFTNA